MGNVPCAIKVINFCPFCLDFLVKCVCYIYPEEKQLESVAFESSYKYIPEAAVLAALSSFH